MTEIEHRLIADAGDFPNNPRLPLLLYRRAIDPGAGDPEAAFEALFAANGWGNGWRNGIFPYHHFHSVAHEVVGVARGTADIQFGGPRGPVLKVGPGDAATIPAGIGHCRLDDAPGLSVIGAYPADQQPDRCLGDEADLDAVRRRIAAVALPGLDPVAGRKGPVVTLWETA